MLKIKSLLQKLFLPALTLLLATCGQSGSNNVRQPDNITVTDFRGKEIGLQEPVSRIVCMIESALSGLYMLGADEKILGVSTGVYNESSAPIYAMLDKRIEKKLLPAPGNWDFVNIESVVALKPDLVIMWSSQIESVNTIEEHGIPVYGVYLDSFSDVYKEIADLGKMTGRQSRADSLIEYTRAQIDGILAGKVPDKKKSVYFIWPQGLLETSGKTSTVDELITLAGANNACTLPREHVVINKETLLDYDPDVILMWYNTGLNPEDVLHMSELQNISAVMNKRVFELPDAFCCDLWTLKYQYAVRLLASYCYPEYFEGIDPDAKLREMILTLYGARAERIFK